MFSKVVSSNLIAIMAILALGYSPVVFAEGATLIICPNGSCFSRPRSPEELEEERKKEEARRRAEAIRAEAARKEKARIDALTADELKRSGWSSSREKEAREMVELRERAWPDAKEAVPEPSKPVCTMEPYKSVASSNWKKSKAEAMSMTDRDALRLCRNNTLNEAYNGSEMKCDEEDMSLWAQMGPLARPAKRPKDDPPNIKYKCSMAFTCFASKRVCKSGPASTTAQ